VRAEVTQELLDRVNQIPWNHPVPLGNGIVAPGLDTPARRESYLHIPERLDELSVLDIGTNDGYFAFQAEQRGASKVVAIDIWDQPTSSKGEGFFLAKQILDSKVDGRKMSVYDLPADLGIFDVIFFFGVLYHLRYPLLALDRIRLCCHSETLLIVESHLDLPEIKRPVAAFYEGDEAGHDPTNWFGPNRACVEAWLKSSGFSRVEMQEGGCNIGQPTYGNELIHYWRAAWHVRS
jgi:tRNA (mo5U34)-methyltransferase